jgi:ACS family glucarate transporter-like MFS transporter
MKGSSPLSGKRRYIALFLFFNIAINYMDRVNLGVAAPAIAKQFHWDPAQMGWLFSAYSWTYALCLLPWGWLADRFNARRIAAIAIFVWSVAAMFTGAATNIANMVAARLGLGVGEAASIPVCNKIIRQWFPAKERGFATTLFHSGIFVTIALSSPFVAWLVVRTGWRASFFITGSLGLIWLLLWLLWFDRPEDCAWLSDGERKLILEHRDSDPASIAGGRDPRPPGFLQAAASLLRNQSMWGLALALGCVNYMNYVFLNWLPSYLVQARGMTILRAGIYSGIPYVVGVTLELCFGRLSDLVLTPQRLKQGARRYQVVLFTLLSSVILLINFTHSQAATLAIISLALACNTTVIAILYALTNDLIENPRLAGTAFGILLLGGNLIGSPASVITGYLVRASGSFSTAFAISGALPLLGAAIAFTFTRRPIRAFRPTEVAEARVAVP